MGRDVTTEHVNETMNKEVAQSKAIAKETEIKKAFEATDSLHYVRNDTFIASPTGMLGTVFYVKQGSKGLIKFPAGVNGSVDEKSILKSPQTRAELILDAKATAAVDVLSYLSASLSAEELYELRVIDNTAGRLIDRGDEWNTALLNWMSTPLAQKIIGDPKVGSVGVVTGVVQKYITTKKYKKFEVGVKGGGFGVNVNGSLYTSSSEFGLDIVYGLDIVWLPGTASVSEFAANVEANKLVNSRAELNKLNGYFAAMVAKTSHLFDA